MRYIPACFFAGRRICSRVDTGFDGVRQRMKQDRMPRLLVVSQPMFLPWVGLFEQIRLSDVFVHYDDVQLPQGRSFMTRVQIKSASGISWLTAPIDHAKSGRMINEVVFCNDRDWRDRHLTTLRHAYGRAPHFRLMLGLAEDIYGCSSNKLSEFNIHAVERIAKWLDLSPRFDRSSRMGVTGKSTQRLVGLCKAENCDTYITGHGALRYLDHQMFEDAGIAVCYMDYARLPYPQGRGEFTPHVSILDAIAHCGERAADLLCSNAVYWKDLALVRNA
jgi:hypothetical protein